MTLPGALIPHMTHLILIPPKGPLIASHCGTGFGHSFGRTQTFSPYTALRKLQQETDSQTHTGLRFASPRPVSGGETADSGACRRG